MKYEKVAHYLTAEKDCEANLKHKVLNASYLFTVYIYLEVYSSSS